jgi:hypothetical protein
VAIQGVILFLGSINFMMKQIGQFQTLDTFPIAGKGRVIICKLIEGKVKIGSYSYLQIENKNYLCNIKGIALMNPPQLNDSTLDLLFYSEEINLEDYQISEQIISIYEQSNN